MIRGTDGIFPGRLFKEDQLSVRTTGQQEWKVGHWT